MRTFKLKYNLDMKFSVILEMIERVILKVPVYFKCFTYKNGEKNKEEEFNNYCDQRAVRILSVTPVNLTKVIKRLRKCGTSVNLITF